MTEHVNIYDALVPKNAKVHHFGCDATTCRTVTLDVEKGDVHITAIVKGVNVSRIIVTADEFYEISVFLSKSVMDDYNKIRESLEIERERIITEIIEEEKEKQKREAS